MGEDKKVNRVNVSIFDDDYIIRGIANKKQIEKVATYVDTQMKQIAMKNPYLTPKKNAVLVAVNIAYEFFQLQQDYEELIKLLDEEKKD